MLNRKIGILIATAALTFTPIAVPHAFAQTTTTATSTTANASDPYFNVNMGETIPAGTIGVLRDGTTVATAPLPNGAAETNVAGLPKYKIYTYEGEDFLMELRQSNKDSKGNVVLNPQGIPVWGYYILSKNGDLSDSCKIDMLTKSVNDPTLYDYTRNGFLYTLGGMENVSNPESQYLHTAIQHWGGSWRFPFAFAQGMSNVVFDVNFPTNWGAPKLSTGTLYTTGSTGQQSYPTQSGATMDVSEFLTVQPYDAAANDAKETAGYYPTKRTYYSPDNWVQPNIVDTVDPYHKQIKLPYAPEDSRFVVQWDQAKLTTASTAPTDATLHFTADKFCYDAATVQQGTKQVVNTPDTSTTTQVPEVFKAADNTPSWVKVDSNGNLTLLPDYNVTPGVYTVPVLVGTQDTKFAPVMVTITVTPAFRVEGYDDAYTGPGTKTVIFPQTLRDIPQGTTFALDESTIPTGWSASIDSATGKITVTPSNDTAPGRNELTVNVSYPLGDGTTQTFPVTAGVQVDRRVTAFDVDDNGHLIVTYNDRSTADLGEVVGPQGQSGDSVRIAKTTTDGDGNTVITFQTVDAKGDVVPGSDYPVTVFKGDTGEKGDTGATGADGKDAAPLTITGTSKDADGNTVITFSDGNTATVAKGEDAAPLTVTKSETDANGNTVIYFSDDSTATVNKGTAVGIKSTVHDDASGTTTITFTDDTTITVLDGVDGAALEITSHDIDPTTGDTTVTFSDGTSMVIPAGQDGTSVEITDTIKDDAGNTIVTFSDGSTIVLPKGTDGKDGQDGASLTVASTSTDADGNTVVTLSDGTVLTLPKGTDGKDGVDGKDAPALTVTGSEVNDRGETIVTFSDGSTVTIPAPQSVRITGTETNPTTGDITVHFSTGEDVTIPAGKDGADGKDAAPLTITGQNVDSATGLLTITFSDGSKVTLPPVAAPKIVNQQIVERTPGNSVVELTYDNGDVVDVPVPANGTDGTSITILEQHTQADGSVEIVFSDGSNVTVPAPQAPRIVSQETDDTGNLIVTWSNGQTVTIPQGPAGEFGVPGQDGHDGKDGQNGTDGKDATTAPSSGSSDLSISSDTTTTGSSGIDQKCLHAGLAVGIPLLALIPIGLMSQMDTPAVSPIMGQMNSQINQLNVQIQKQLGLFNPQGAGATAEFNRVTGQIGKIAGQVGGGVLIAGLGLLVANYLAQACSPDAQGFLPSSSAGSSES